MMMPNCKLCATPDLEEEAKLKKLCGAPFAKFCKGACRAMRPQFKAPRQLTRREQEMKEQAWFEANRVTVTQMSRVLKRKPETISRYLHNLNFKNFGSKMRQTVDASCRIPFTDLCDCDMYTGIFDETGNLRNGMNPFCLLKLMGVMEQALFNEPSTETSSSRAHCATKDPAAEQQEAKPTKQLPPEVKHLSLFEIIGGTGSKHKKRSGCFACVDPFSEIRTRSSNDYYTRDGMLAKNEYVKAMLTPPVRSSSSEEQRQNLYTIGLRQTCDHREQREAAQFMGFETETEPVYYEFVQKPRVDNVTPYLFERINKLCPMCNIICCNDNTQMNTDVEISLHEEPGNRTELIANLNELFNTEQVDQSNAVQPVSLERKAQIDDIEHLYSSVVQGATKIGRVTGGGCTEDFGVVKKLNPYAKMSRRYAKCTREPIYVEGYQAELFRQFASTAYIDHQKFAEVEHRFYLHEPTPILLR